MFAPQQMPGTGNHSWVDWWEAENEKQDEKFPEWGLNWDLQGLSQRHLTNFTDTTNFTPLSISTHAHTHTHMETFFPIGVN